MNYYLLIKREAVTPAGAILSARESAIALLEAGVWPLWRHTRNRKAIRAGDQVAIYLSGEDNQVVIATARVREVSDWDRVVARAYPLVLDGEPLAVLRLVDTVVFAEPKAVKPRLQQLSFYRGGTKWGVAFMGGTRALTAPDYHALTA
jgi:hypothetical protein